MANSIFSGMPSGGNGGLNIINFLSEFNKFKKSITGKDPNAMLNELMNTGRVSKEQYEQAKALAQKISMMIGK